jgi:hypothetical protein
VLGAYEFGLVAEGVDREGIAERCLEVIEESQLVLVLEETMMRRVEKEAVKRLALTRAKQGSDGRRLGWRCVRDVVHIKAPGVGQDKWCKGFKLASGFHARA